MAIAINIVTLITHVTAPSHVYAHCKIILIFVLPISEFDYEELQKETGSYYDRRRVLTFSETNPCYSIKVLDIFNCRTSVF